MIIAAVRWGVKRARASAARSAAGESELDRYQYDRLSGAAVFRPWLEAGTLHSVARFCIEALETARRLDFDAQCTPVDVDQYPQHHNTLLVQSFRDGWVLRRWSAQVLDLRDDSGRTERIHRSRRSRHGGHQGDRIGRRLRLGEFYVQERRLDLRPNILQLDDRLWRRGVGDGAREDHHFDGPGHLINIRNRLEMGESVNRRDVQRRDCAADDAAACRGRPAISASSYQSTQDHAKRLCE